MVEAILYFLSFTDLCDEDEAAQALQLTAQQQC